MAYRRITGGAGYRYGQVVAGRILIGTSSWADPGFVEEWYPPGMPARDRLGWYAERFQAVEVNSTFYAVPDQGTVARWAQVTPDDFAFDVKLHRLLSRHHADLKSLPPELREGADTAGRGRVVLTPKLEAALVDALLEAVEPLKQAGKLGAFLLQLTPAFGPRDHDLSELDSIVELLKPHTVAIELRHRGWVRDKRVEQTLGWYEDHGAAWVAVDAPPGDQIPIMPPVDAVTTKGLAYMRMHGRDTEGYLTGKSVAERFAWDYSEDELREIGGRVEGLAEQAGEVHALFNNNRGADAPSAAQRFRILMGQDEAPPPDPPRQQLELG
jgi:uncharacterized protein YecE (DUF72 family)